jgi:hypothetical protein
VAQLQAVAGTASPDPVQTVLKTRPFHLVTNKPNVFKVTQHSVVLRILQHPCDIFCFTLGVANSCKDTLL